MPSENHQLKARGLIFGTQVGVLFSFTGKDLNASIIQLFKIAKSAQF